MLRPIQYNVWIAVDHVKNQYRTWFHFSIKGLTKGTVVTFNIKNMQNQVHLSQGSQDCSTRGLFPSTEKRTAMIGRESPIK
jgi:hypothetical protein